MHTDFHDLFVSGNPNLVGELLRGAAFVEEFGCYSCFEVRDDAVKWSDDALRDFWREIISKKGNAAGFSPEELEEEALEYAELGAGYTFTFDRYTIEMAWYWDGDGSLLFHIYDLDDQPIRSLSNGDCKKDYVWIDLKFEPDPSSI
jgi:hypothetical protein